MGSNCVGPFARVDIRGNYLPRRRIDILIDQDNVKRGGISTGHLVREKYIGAMQWP